jgi:serine/threonine-protein kinase RsbW
LDDDREGFSADLPIKMSAMPFDLEPLSHQVVIPSDLRIARRLEERILQEAEACGYSPELAFAIRLALEEAIVNAHKHGNGSDPTRQIVVSYDVNPQRVVIRVRDEGQGFNPAGVPDPTSPDRISLPNGRGIMLMHAYLDKLTFNEQGNEVQLVKEKS